MVAGVSPPVTSHLSLVPQLLSQTLKPGDMVVDATAGNGYDTLALARLVLGGGGRVVSMDVQQCALKATEARLLQEFTQEEVASGVTFIEGNHRDFSRLDELTGPGQRVKAFIYNLGYLPGSDKSVATSKEDTIDSLKQAAQRTSLGGLVCVTCYRGHEGGLEETNKVREELSSWEQAEWRVCETTPLNWPVSPILMTAHRFEEPRRRLPKKNSLNPR